MLDDVQSEQTGAAYYIGPRGLLLTLNIRAGMILAKDTALFQSNIAMLKARTPTCTTSAAGSAAFSYPEVAIWQRCLLDTKPIYKRQQPCQQHLRRLGPSPSARGS